MRCIRLVGLSALWLALVGMTGCGDEVPAPPDEFGDALVPREASMPPALDMGIPMDMDAAPWLADMGSVQGADAGRVDDAAPSTTDTGVALDAQSSNEDAAQVADMDTGDAALVPIEDAMLNPGADGGSDADADMGPPQDAALGPDAGPPPAMGGVSQSGAVANGRVAGNANGGQRFQDDCPDGQVLVGVAGAMRVGAGYLGQLQAVCGQVVIGVGGVTTERGAAGGLRGGRGGGAIVSSTCPNGQAVVGHSGRSGNLMDQLRLHCAPLLVFAGGVVPGAEQGQQPIGGQGGDAYNLIPCPVDHVAIGAVIRAGDGIDGFGLRCSALRVVP